MADLPHLDRGRLSRRAVMGLSVASVAALAGCSDTSVATPSVHAATKAASVTPDVRTATAALAAIRSAHAAVRATAQRFPAARAQLAGLDAMHTAHERSLVDAVPAQARSSAPPSAYAVPARRPAALQRLAATEVRLHDALQALALTAESGEFARLLASMAAAVTVHRQALAGAGG
ncbi:MAG: hypothetical protein JOZ82_09870 [Marmoricola sp.]|nr:hypothetical protein [Marmoricola sp.]